MRHDCQRFWVVMGQMVHAVVKLSTGLCTSVTDLQSRRMHHFGLLAQEWFGRIGLIMGKALPETVRL